MTREQVRRMSHNELGYGMEMVMAYMRAWLIMMKAVGVAKPSVHDTVAKFALVYAKGNGRN